MSNPAHLYVHHMYVVAHTGHREVLDPLEPERQQTVNCLLEVWESKWAFCHRAASALNLCAIPAAFTPYPRLVLYANL